MKQIKETLAERCFLFDIDGTLLDARHLWEKAFRGSYQELYGITLTPEEERSFFGPPPLEGHRRVLEGRGIYSPEKLPLLIKYEQSAMFRLIGQNNLDRHVLPGVHDFLLALEREEATVGILTGNLEQMAEALLEKTHLRPFFDFLACAAPTTQDRAEILDDALQQLQDEDLFFPPDKIYVIGDTPLDIQAAKARQCKSVAVATGHYKMEELRACEPDYTLENLTHYSRLLDSTVA